VCGCSLPPQQQQGGLKPLQRKSLLPPVPPTSAGSSSVEAVFGGVLSSRITCTACGYCSISYEPFLDLSLPIPLGNGPEEGLTRKVRGGGSAWVLLWVVFFGGVCLGRGEDRERCQPK
jgi:hypothetical protein